MRNSLLLSACSAVAALVMGCGPGPGGAIPERVDECPTSFEEDFPATRKVEVGEGTGDSFLAYQNGQDVTMVQGGQGATMITPTLRVEATPTDAAEACYRVRLENDYKGALTQDPEGLDATQSNITFVRSGDYLVTDGAMYHPFVWDASDLEGLTMALTATVQGDGFQGSTTVDIVLR